MRTTDNAAIGAFEAARLPYPPELVVAVNRVYHDVEGAAYRHRHPEIFQEEGGRWQRIAERFLAGRPSPLRILDVGSGTGFVPSVIAPSLKRGDTVVCTDVSERILACCRESLSTTAHACDFRFETIDGTILPFEDDSFDAVTANSVAHHVPRLAAFFSEVKRVLRGGGLLLIGHEPNRPFYTCRPLWRLSRLLEAFFRPRVAAVWLAKVLGVDALLQAFGIRDRLRRVFVSLRPGLRHHRGVLDAVNDRLREEGAIREPLTHEEITEIVDIHSPDAGVRLAADRGFEIEEILTRYLPGFGIEYFETYNHLAGATSLNRVTRRLDAVLRRRFPLHGATLFAVLRKE